MECGRARMEMIAKAGKAILDTLFPIECLGCFQEGEWICQKCALRIPIAPQISCLHCKTSSPEGKTCFGCQREFPVARLVRFFDYDVPIIKKGIHTAKYSYVKTIFERFMDIATPHALAALESGEIDPRALTFIPVPLFPRRARHRGFNQAEVIARRAAQVCGAFFCSALVRTRATLAQADLDEADRGVNIAGAFVCRARELVEGKDLVLTDDVATTGNTLAECARVLRASGAREVWALTLAKG